MKTQITIAALIAAAGMAQADIVISEVLGSTASTDAEYIEIYNDGYNGTGATDLTGWTIELWDSDTGSAFGGSDAASPYALSGILGVGQTLTLGNSLAAGAFGASAFDLSLPANAVENSSYTIILADASSNVVWSAFVSDGDAGDSANRAGAGISTDISVGPDGSFLPAGYRINDASGSFDLLDFSNYAGTPSSGYVAGDPGVANYAAAPTPGTAALLGLGGLVATRRRR